MDDPFLEYIHVINKTDNYANYNIQQRPNDNKIPWSIPTLPEIKAFPGLTYQMGISRKPSTKLYRSTDPIMVTPIFSSTLNRDRYTQILRYLHFSDHVNEPRQEPFLQRAAWLLQNFVRNCIEGANIADQGYHGYTDNSFTSPNLYLEFWENYETAACGTVRTSRTSLPKNIMCQKPVNISVRGDLRFRQKGDF
ncbi:unnamed protein product [Mytilus coruscus]|uniref:PiggyBac transposable element-derived protein domain-containing protein n=1 Tax=Mytilus coruscus TaxID=42192 RepID=A0A6J8CCA6_MYTCO|nr:unnamed protein product [Mytilus coruscus]